MRINRDSLAALLATAAFLTVVALGFWKTHGPSTQRLVRADEKRVRNMSQLANEINGQYRQHDKQLPERLNDSQKTRYADPVTGKPLEYSSSTPRDFVLCGTFSTSSPREQSSGMFAFWTHPSGPKCFEFSAGEVIPQAPYSYY
jgi:hypothetical protein